jgi:hypothetical protein
MQFNISLVTSLAFKTAGVVLIISTIVDVIFALLPYKFNDSSWWVVATSELVNRGLLPLVGIVFLTAGEWIENISRDGKRADGKWGLVTAWFSVVLGLLFLVITPFQAWSGNSERDKTVADINKRVGETEAQINRELGIIKDKGKIQQQLAEWDKQIKGGQLQGQALEQLKAQRDKLSQLSADPAQLSQQSTQFLEGLRKQQQDANDQAIVRMWKTGIRSSLASLLLASGYSFIGFIGLRGRKL